MKSLCEHFREYSSESKDKLFWEKVLQKDMRAVLRIEFDVGVICSPLVNAIKTIQI